MKFLSVRDLRSKSVDTECLGGRAGAGGDFHWRIPVVPPPSSPPPPEALPGSGRLMVSKLVRRVVQSQPDGEPFGATAVTSEVNRRFATHLKRAVGPRTVSDVLRRMAIEGAVQAMSEGTAYHETRYTKGARQGG